MIACVSPTEKDLSETLNTLRYADRAKNMRKPPIPQHLLQFSAKKRKFSHLNLPKTPGKFLKLNNTLGPATPISAVKSTPKFNHTVSKSQTQCGKTRNSLSPKKYFVKSTIK